MLFVSNVLHVPDDVVEEIDKIMFKFLWNGRQHKVKKKVITQNIENGGCKMIDLVAKLKAQKIEWVKKMLDDTNGHIWRETMKTILGVQNISLFLNSNYIIPKKITKFYKAVLESFNDVKYTKCDCAEDVLQQMLWYNKNIIINKKSLYNKHFIDKGILQIRDIVNENGEIKSFEDICEEFGIQQKYFILYAGILKSIPLHWKHYVKDAGLLEINNECLLMINGSTYNIMVTDTQKIYSELVASKLERSNAAARYSELYGINADQWKNIYVLPNTLKLSNKIKENNFKILHNYIATNKLLFRMKKIVSPRCNFCNLYDQDTCHMLYNCLPVKNIWFKVEEWLLMEYNIRIVIVLRDVLFGHDYNQDENVVNRIIMLAKGYIVQCKYKEQEIRFNDLISFINAN